ncbi:MAG: Mu transposase C-terminal domain-containing protein [Solirubrobacteraceae bacterium]
MSSLATELSVGTGVMYDGEGWRVTGLEGSAVLIRSSRGRVLRIRTATLVSHPSTTLLADLPVVAEASLGVALASLSPAQAVELREQVEHVLEVLTGYRSGDPLLVRAGEPRPQYLPSLALGDRREAKAAELGVSTRSLKRWMRAYSESGPAGLLDGRLLRERAPLDGIDERWVGVATTVLAEHTDASTVTKQLMLERVSARLDAEFGEGVVRRPGAKRAGRALGELARGSNAFSGSAKGRRSIAGRPAAPYGRLRPTRPGEYLMLDVTPLDVFAMDPVTLRWVPLQLALALDLFSRCVVAVRLSSLSVKAVDAALLLFEAISPDSRELTGGGLLPYGGTPTCVFVPGERLLEGSGLPAVAPETVVIDHGRIFLSDHLRSVNERFGISVQPARPYMGSDKAALERLFRTLREGLLEALPSYKGPDVYSRGADVEDLAFYFRDELERIIRQWIAQVYHRTPHDGLVDPSAPGLAISPLEMLELGVARAGRLRVPLRPNTVYDFLPVAWRQINHYGIELHGLIYDGPTLNQYRRRASPYGGAKAGKWPFRYDPDDISRLFFQDPETLAWHPLWWRDREEIKVPFSGETLAYAKRLAATTDRHPHARQALRELLERWDAGLTANPTERRIAIRLSEQRAARLGEGEHEPLPTVEDLPEVRAVRERSADGDDDRPEDLADLAPDEISSRPVSEEDFYADALEVLG